MKLLLFGAAIVAVALAAWLAWRWHGQPQQVPEMAPRSAQADSIEVFKAERRLELRREGLMIKSYRIVLGFAPDGHKDREGDGRTPEGEYAIDARNPKSAFHLSLRVSYPDDKDKARSAAAGVSPGGEIYIHGQPNGTELRADHPERDWTTGCLAVTNAEIREIWSLVPTGTAIRIHQ